MNLHPEIIRELRTLFKDGATPSRLIRHIVERHEGERSYHALIQAYFFEAFGVPMVRGLSPTDDYQHADLRYAFLNEQLLHEMIQKRSEWENRDEKGTNGAGTWLDSLRANDDHQRLQQAQETLPPDLRRCWPLLTAEEQYYIQLSMASANGVFETVKILARLIERLQQKVSARTKEEETGSYVEPNP